MTEINEQDLLELTQSGKPFIVIYGAVWCQPCQALRMQFIGSVIYYINVDTNHSLCNAMKIMSVPTGMLYQHGKISERVGNIAQSTIKEWLRIVKGE